MLQFVEKDYNNILLNVSGCTTLCENSGCRISLYPYLHTKRNPCGICELAKEIIF
jgi:hypothetical protein